MKKLQKFLYFPLFLFGFNLQSQTNFFSPDTIQVIEIHFSQPNWDFIMDTAKASFDGYTFSDTVKINGTLFFNVGVKYKGSSSYDSTRQKNPLHIKLDHTNPIANYFGVKDIKLSNGFSDPSMVREALGYDILRNYMDAPLSNFAKIFINGVYYGVYNNSQDINNLFLHQHFYSSGGNFFKANPQNVINGHLPSLVYLGPDSTQYFDRYELKSIYGWKNLVKLCDTLVNFPAEIENTLDIDRALWMIAFNNVTVNLDSYTGAFAQNYYLYRDHHKRFNPIVWDLNMCFGAFTNTGTANLNLQDMQEMSPVLQSANASRPLIMNLLADDRFHKMYIAHMRTINKEFFSNGLYQGIGQGFQALIDSSVMVDSFALYTYPQFQQGFSTTVGTIPGIDNLMIPRASFLDNTPEFLLTPPMISGAFANPSIPVFGSSFFINAGVTNATEVYLGYRYKKSDRFSKIQMFDDGLHGDGPAGDKIFGIDITANSLDIQYYIYADNADAGIFSPERAEHEFFSVFPSITQAAAGDIGLNEFVGDNVNGMMDEDGEHSEWLELINKTGNDLGLKNLFLSDHFGNLQKWRFPDEAFIPANGFQLAWVDNDNANWVNFHTNFGIDWAGDSLILSDSLGNILDSIIFIPPSLDTAMARCPDGSGAFQLSVVSTPLDSNICTFISSDKPQTFNNEIFIYPNPAGDFFQFVYEGEVEIISLSIISLEGKVVKSIQDPQGSIEISEFPSGVYILNFNLSNGSGEFLRMVKI